jgi:CRP-like cAMP-binding protein
MSRQETIPDGTALTTEGQVSPFLYFILEGQAKVYHNKTFAAFVDQGGFVNDVAFQQTQSQQKKQQHSSIRQGEGAYGTVVTNGDCKVLVWDQEALKEHLANRLDMDRNLKYLLSQHLMKSLLKQREARHALECGEDGQRHQQQVETSSTSATTEGWYSMAPNA